jgi:hypothetical protein
MFKSVKFKVEQHPSSNAQKIFSLTVTIFSHFFRLCGRVAMNDGVTAVAGRY